MRLSFGFEHPRASGEARRIGERGSILRTPIGSGVDSTLISGQDDRQKMGICLEPPEFVTGLARHAGPLDQNPPWTLRFLPGHALADDRPLR